MTWTNLSAHVPLHLRLARRAHFPLVFHLLFWLEFLLALLGVSHLPCWSTRARVLYLLCVGLQCSGDAYVCFPWAHIGEKMWRYLPSMRHRVPLRFMYAIGIGCAHDLPFAPVACVHQRPWVFPATPLSIPWGYHFYAGGQGCPMAEALSLLCWAVCRGCRRVRNVAYTTFYLIAFRGVPHS